jgi:WD40 repeat protein
MMRHALGCLAITSLAFLSPVGIPVDFSSVDNPKAVANPKLPRVDSFGDPLPDGVFYRLGTMRLRHQETRTLIFSADGSQLLSQGATPDLRVWDAATGRLLQQFAAPEECRQLIASPDDRYLACTANSQNQFLVVLLDKATGKELARWKHANIWRSLAFSKDGKELVALTWEQTVVRWNLAERKETARIQLDMTKVDVKDFYAFWGLSPDGSKVVFTETVAPLNENPTVPWHFWDTASGKQCRPPLMMPTDRSEVRWSPDGRMLAVVYRDYTLEVWDIVAGKRLALDPARPVKKGEPAKLTARAVAFHPGGKLLAVEHNNGRVTMWDLDAKKQLWGKELSGEVLAFSPDGKTLAVGSGIISLAATATGEPVGFTKRDPGWFELVGWDRSPSFLRDGRSFAVYDAVGISQLETSTGKRLRTYDTRKHAWYSYGILCDHRSLIACMGADERDGAQVLMFEAATGKELWRRPVQSSAIYLAADGKKIAAVSWKQNVFTFLDAATGGEIKKVPAPSYRKDYGTWTAVSDDLNLMAVSHNFQKIDLWDLDTGKKLRTLDGPEGHGDMFFLPGNLIVAAVSRAFIRREEKRPWTRVWDAATGRIHRSVDEPLLKMSDDGRWLALQADKAIAIRHLHTGKLVATVGGVDPLAFSPDGSLLAVRNESWHEVDLWDTFTGRRVGRWVEPLSQFQRAAFSPDGRTLMLTVRGGGSILVCDVTGRATEPGKIPPQDLTFAEADRYWLELTSDDGPRSHQARWSLVAGGNHTIKMLQRRMRRAEPLDGKDLAVLLAGLDSSSFAERQKSSNALEQMELAKPALEDALKRNPSLEMKRRIELILAKQDGLVWDVELRRAMRGVLLLEQIGTPPARQLLQTLVSGAAGSLLTQEAQAALQRLGGR